MVISDALDRPLHSLRISVTDRCNLRCQYCMPEKDYVWLPRRDLLTFEEISFLVDVFASVGVDKVRITGGEPLLRKDLADLLRLLAAKSPIQDLALTTNGILLADQAARLRAAGLHRITVSLDTLRADRFRSLTRFDALEDVRAGLAVASRHFDRIKVDTVVIKGINDDEMTDILEYGRSYGAEVRFIEYMDVGGATQWSMNEVISRADMLRAIEKRYGRVTPVDEESSAPADRFALGDGTTFGIISSTTAPFCRACDRSRLTADGTWYLCLYARSGTDLREPLRDGASAEELRGLITPIWTARGDRGAELRLAAENRQSLIPIETLQKDPHLEMHTRGGRRGSRLRRRRGTAASREQEPGPIGVDRADLVVDQTRVETDPTDVALGWSAASADARFGQQIHRRPLPRARAIRSIPDSSSRFDDVNQSVRSRAPWFLRRSVTPAGSEPSAASNTSGALTSTTTDDALMPSFLTSGVPE